ncbi:MAG: S41 family peptidase, partial [Candidatus Hodarchaeota archaeon]
MNTNIVNEQQKSKIIQEINKLLQERYIFPKMAKKIAGKLEDNFEKGEYQNINDLSSFALNLRKTLNISKDKHLCVLYDQEHLKRIIDNRSDKKEAEKLELLNKIRIGKKENFGFVKVEILEGNIGLIDLRKFYNTKIKEAGKAATAALQFLRNTDAIIIDLRNNGGGEPEMVQLLASYFFEDRTRLNSIERPYEGYVEQYWTYPYLPGKNHSDKDLYILTSKNTFSAAEDFIYALQCQKRAIIVGEITKGGAHPVDFFSIQDLLVL